MRDSLVIYGVGAVAKMAYQIVDDINRANPTWKVVGYLDDNQERHGSEVHGVPVLGGALWLAAHPDVAVAIGIGHPGMRSDVAQRLLQLGHQRYATLIHPRAWISARVTIGVGTMIYPDVLIDCDVVIGEHVILNKSCTLGHDSMIGAFTTIAPGVNLGGNVTIGEGCDFGINSATIQGVTIGARSIVGAGAVVLHNLPSDVTAVGVPARVISTRMAGARA